jgi:hypothetical protein
MSEPASSTSNPLAAAASSPQKSCKYCGPDAFAALGKDNPIKVKLREEAKAEAARKAERQRILRELGDKAIEESPELKKCIDGIVAAGSYKKWKEARESDAAAAFAAAVTYAQRMPSDEELDCCIRVKALKKKDDGTFKLTIKGPVDGNGQCTDLEKLNEIQQQVYENIIRQLQHSGIVCIYFDGDKVKLIMSIGDMDGNFRLDSEGKVIPY